MLKVQLDKLLKMLPRTLALKSKPEAQAKGKLATNVNGEANSTIMQKDDILAQKGKRERQNTGDAGDAPVSIMASGRQDTKAIMYDNAVFGMSKLVWKNQTSGLVCAAHGRQEISQTISKIC